MRFLYVILDILEPLKIITKMAELQSVTMPYLQKVRRTNRDFGVFKTHPGSNERNFENLIVTVEAPNPMQPFWIFCCNLFPFVATFLNKGIFRCYNQNL